MEIGSIESPTRGKTGFPERYWRGNEPEPADQNSLSVRRQSHGRGLFSALNLITNLDRWTFEPVVVLHELGPFADYLRQRDIPFEHLPVAAYHKARKLPIRGFELLRTVLPLVRFLSKADIDIVHTNQTRTHLTWATPARRAGRRFVWHVRTTQFAKRWRTYMDLAQNADRILCVSEYIRETVPLELFREETEGYEVNLSQLPPCRTTKRRGGEEMD